jgi:hypothetical protein
MRLCYCEAKIALSNSLAALGVFSLAYNHNRGKYRVFMHLSLSLLCPPELHCFAYLIYCIDCATTGPVLYGGLAAVQLQLPHLLLLCTVLLLYMLFRKASKR